MDVPGGGGGAGADLAVLSNNSDIGVLAVGGVPHSRRYRLEDHRCLWSWPMEECVVSARDGVKLHVGMCGSGPDVVVLSGGPGCVQYLGQDHLAPVGLRAWFPEPRGVGRSSGAAHTMAQAVEDLEQIRSQVGINSWIVVGHSWGSDLAVRYALDHPASVIRVVGVAGHGLHKDRTRSEQ